MNELSLFTGAGGGLLGTKLLGWRPIGYVEINEYCQKVIAQRIKDGFLEEAPIFGDIRAFIDQGYAESYTGLVDVVTAGFPCQPFSVAGKRKGADDERNMWPATIRTIRIVRPKHIFLENVTGILADRYFGTIYWDLAESGYMPRHDSISAKALGFSHRRERLWVVDTNAKRMRRKRIRYTPGPKREKHEFERLVQEALQSELSVRTRCGISDGVANRMDRLKAIGNGQVPAVVRAAWELLS